MSHAENGHAFEIVVPDGGAWGEIGIAFAAYFIVSFLWWGPLLGKKWAQEMGFDASENGGMGMAMVLQAISTFFIAYVLWHTMHAFMVGPGADGLAMYDVEMMPALTGAFFTWLGFFVPMQLGRVAWEKASWTLFGVNAGGQLVGLIVMGLVFALVPL